MLIPINSTSADLEVKKSKFISIVSPITSPEEVKQKIHETWKEHPHASHVVHAFIFGKTGDIFGMSDDHEPKNTAGRPILEILKGSGITNVVILVIRYFGGTKLGTGGLVKAYGDAAKAVLDKVKTEELIEKQSFSLEIPYNLYEQIKLMLDRHHAEEIQEDFTTEVHISGMLPAYAAKEAAEEIQDLSSGRIQLKTDPGRNEHS